jgi:hypothetical protein
MLLHQPLAGAAKLQPRAVHQQVHGFTPAARPRHLQRLGSARAVDHTGMVLDVLVQSRRDKHAAKRLLRKLLKRQCRAPRVMITDSSPAMAWAVSMRWRIRTLMEKRCAISRLRSHLLCIVRSISPAATCQSLGPTALNSGALYAKGHSRCAANAGRLREPGGVHSGVDGPPVGRHVLPGGRSFWRLRCLHHSSRCTGSSRIRLKCMQTAGVRGSRSPWRKAYAAAPACRWTNEPSVPVLAGMACRACPVARQWCRRG